MEKVKAELGADKYAAGKYDEAAKMFDDLVAGDDLVEFLTLPAYERMA
jgi:malate synthase